MHLAEADELVGLFDGPKPWKITSTGSLDKATQWTLKDLLLARAKLSRFNFLAKFCREPVRKLAEMLQALKDSLATNGFVNWLAPVEGWHHDRFGLGHSNDPENYLQLGKLGRSGRRSIDGSQTPDHFPASVPQVRCVGVILNQASLPQRTVGQDRHASRTMQQRQEAPLHE